ncbi:hypothetical protein Btru_051711 [Bulinus truncatus]|nr:hypothetical protein Btru_051711 [Bulinus truncatus]
MKISIVQLSVFVLFAAHYSLCHVIGGGLNTDFDSAEEEPTPGWLKSAVSSSRQARSVKDGKVKSSNVAVKVKKVKNAAKVNQRKEKNPFLRGKRQTVNCQLPSNIPEMVSGLNSFLNASQFVGKVDQVDSYTPLPTNQPAVGDCPARNGSWWPRPEMNLRSTCPWIYVENNLGSNFYPSKLQEAKCLCQKCVTATSMTCEHLKQKVTVFKRGPCRDGVAVMTKIELSITVGCHCANAVETVVPVTSG